jgi:predicted glutamate--cysteine ligase
MSKSLLKGFEVELYTGRADGTVVGCSAEAAAALDDVVTEPDCRNLEYVTAPESSYSKQLEQLQEPRRKLRRWLTPKGLTLLPGSTLSLGDSQRFERSDPTNPYHSYIESTYGTRVVTASVHINLGLENLEQIFAACRLLRCEAALLLALSASSPFLDGKPTGAHSQRWLQFPITPTQVPLFKNHDHYVAWMESQLRNGNMRNVRHLWSSVRPNGPDRPQLLNRVELRICDLVTDPKQLLAITAFVELRLLQLLENANQHDPLCTSKLNLEELQILADANDQAAAKGSLEATLLHWRDGEPINTRWWLKNQLAELRCLPAANPFLPWLAPLDQMLETGNTAINWLEMYKNGESISAIIGAGATAMELEEKYPEVSPGALVREGYLG